MPAPPRLENPDGSAAELGSNEIEGTVGPVVPAAESDAPASGATERDAATTSSAAESPAPFPWRWLALVLGVVALLGCVRFGNGFVMDDQAMIVDGQVIHDLANIPALFAHHALWVSGEEREAISTWRPLTLTFFVLDAQWSGRDTWGYHLTNLLAHLAVTLLVFVAAHRLCGPPPPPPTPGDPLPWRMPAAAFAALFHGLHPAGIEAHVWINGRSDVFAALFLAGALLTLVGPHRGASGPHASTVAPSTPGPATARPSVGRCAAAALLLFLAALCKEVAVLGVPALVWLTASRVEPAERARAARDATLALGASALTYAVLRTAVLSGAAAGTAQDQLLALRNFGLVQLDGLRTVLLPSTTGMRVIGADYALLPPIAFPLAWAVMLGLAAWAFVARRRAPLVFAALLALGAFMAPIAVLSAVEWPGFNRYVYLPLIFVAIALGGLWRTLRPDHPVLAFPAGTWLVLMTLLTLGGTLEYRTMASFLRSIESASPNAKLLDAALGNLAFREGRCEDAVPRLTRAITWEPDHHEARTHLAVCLVEAGDASQALTILDAGLALDPRNGDLRNARARALFPSGVDATVAELIACVRDADDGARCAASLERLLSEHPEGARLRARVAAEEAR